jgi:predicted neutral ceramidase superfamily lipid hydrolase
MGVVARIFLMIVGYFLACLAASAILTIGTLTPEWDDLVAAGFNSTAAWVVILLGAFVIAAIAMVPSLLVIALAEGFGWRSIVIYGVLGGALALALTYGLDFAGYVGDPEGFLAREREVLAASGIVGGFVYWLVAGRGAGSWQR